MSLDNSVAVVETLNTTTRVKSRLFLRKNEFLAPNKPIRKDKNSKVILELHIKIIRNEKLNVLLCNFSSCSVFWTKTNKQTQRILNQTGHVVIAGVRDIIHKLESSSGSVYRRVIGRSLCLFFKTDDKQHTVIL